MPNQVLARAKYWSCGMMAMYQYDFVRFLLVLGFMILLVLGLFAAQASDASDVPPGITPPAYQPITKAELPTGL
jgi:hypothetical protein